MIFCKKLLLGSFLLFVGLSSCKNDPKSVQTAPEAPKKETGAVIQAEPELTTEGAAVYAVTDAVISWQGKKTVTGSTHTGTINASGGELLVKDGRILEGSVKIDMNSIAVTDIKDAAEKKDLEDHLKNGDFFDVGKYPTAEYTIEETLPTQIPGFNRAVVGKLTMKGKSNEVNIPITLEIKDNAISASSGTVSINRTQWGINYNSSTLAGTVKDRMIDDVILINLKLNAKLKAATN